MTQVAQINAPGGRFEAEIMSTVQGMADITMLIWGVSALCSLNPLVYLQLYITIVLLSV